MTKQLEDILNNDSEWELFQNFMGIWESEGLSLRASVSLAEQQLDLMGEVVTALENREDDGEQASALEDSLMN